MFSINLERSVVTLAVMAGLLAVAGPASAQGGGADLTRSVEIVLMADSGGQYYALSESQPGIARVGGKMHLEDVSMGIRGDAQDTQTALKAGSEVLGYSIGVADGRLGHTVTMLDYDGSP